MGQHGQLSTDDDQDGSCLCCPGEKDTPRAKNYDFFENDIDFSNSRSYGINPISLFLRSGMVGVFEDPLAEKVCQPAHSCKSVSKECPDGCRCQRYCRVHCRDAKKENTCEVELCKLAKVKCKTCQYVMITPTPTPSTTTAASTTTTTTTPAPTTTSATTTTTTTMATTTEADGTCEPIYECHQCEVVDPCVHFDETTTTTTTEGTTNRKAHELLSIFS